ncbi:MAG: hypothetical protein JST27_05710 [Bacteroidetes bacterium]|nr:hypothetical protein [Bacteroidota bacterium]
MTQVKLWQIVSQTANAIIFSDADGNLKTLPAGTTGQVLVAALDGSPMWADNTALATALSAKTDATNAIATAKAYADAQIAALIDNAPVALNTLNELAVKLNGEDSAINALLLQVDGKAEKTEVVTAVAQAKQDAIQTAQENTNVAVGNALNEVDSRIAIARGDLQTYADQTAAFKSDNAKQDAVTSANSYTDQAIAGLAQGVALDADNRADTIKSEAVLQANTYTDSVFANAATTTEGLIETARMDAIHQASTETGSRISTLMQNIPGTYHVETTSVASYVSDSTLMDMQEITGPGVNVKARFSEITGANIGTVDDTLSPKMLLVNGVAQHDEWSTEAAPGGALILKMTPKLAAHVFDGTKNYVMLLAEYKKYSSLSFIPAD